MQVLAQEKVAIKLFQRNNCFRVKKLLLQIQTWLNRNKSTLKSIREYIKLLRKRVN